MNSVSPFTRTQALSQCTRQQAKNKSGCGGCSTLHAMSTHRCYISCVLLLCTLHLISTNAQLLTNKTAWRKTTIYQARKLQASQLRLTDSQSVHGTLGLATSIQVASCSCPCHELWPCSSGCGLVDGFGVALRSVTEASCLMHPSQCMCLHVG